jgi:hypothetical protein
MKYLCVTLIFLLVVLFSPQAALASAWLYWLVRAVVLVWAIWLQRRILKGASHE